MPTYEYRCKKCEHRFERMMPIGEHERRKTKPACPECNSRSVEQVVGVFQAVTSKKT